MRREGSSLHLGPLTESVKEGAVKVLVPKVRFPPSKAPVFYNPNMEFNRDVAVVVLQTYQKMLSRKLRVCEPLAGCGVRAVRFATEVEGIKQVIVNDLNPEAAKLAEYNVKMNALSRRVLVKNTDANELLGTHSAPARRFDYIDVDPFGSPAPFIDSAVRALRNSGLLALTATDMPPLCGVHPEACLRRYGGKPLRTEYCHEVAVRLLIGCLALTASRHKVGIQVLFCHSTDHYVRVYATVKRSVRWASRSVNKIGYVSHCFNCFHRETTLGIAASIRDFCPECGGKMGVAGPLWLGELFDKDFCRKMINETRKREMRGKLRLEKLLRSILLDSEGIPTYYVIDKICDKIGLPIPPTREVIKELQTLGYKASLTHFHDKGIRTDSPSQILVQIVRKLSKN